MKWYVITCDCADLAAVAKELVAEGCSYDSIAEPVKLGADEVMLEVVGPEDLPERMSGREEIVRICHEVDFE